jgi:hypothetical protein
MQAQTTMKQTMMIMMAAAAFILAAGCASNPTPSAAVDYVDYGGVDDFFYRNPDVVDHGPNHRLSEPTYLLIYPQDFNDLDQRYKAEGYVRIGWSSWINGQGRPEREQALNFARKIGADRVLYYLSDSPPKWIDGVSIERTGHSVAFYAKVN